jgi:hypothetical protein
MTRFEHVKEILDRAVAGQTVHAHGAFWRGLTRDEFVQRSVFGRPLLVVGDAAASNLPRALRGVLPFGSDVGEPDARFRRMPAGLPPVREEDIVFIEHWIAEGCLEDEFVPPRPAGALAAGAAPTPAAPGVHLAYWRDLDNWSLFNRPPGVEEAIGEVFSRASLWHRQARDPANEPEWSASLNEPGAAPAWALLAGRQAQTVRAHYGNAPAWADVAIGYQDFGADTLPSDPLRPQDPRHRMNGVDMWFYWVAFSDGAIRLNLEPDFWREMLRVLLIGALNDGLVRGRFNVNGFAPGAGSQPEVLAFAEGLPAVDLPRELARRYVESGLA